MKDRPNVGETWEKYNGRQVTVEGIVGNYEDPLVQVKGARTSYPRMSTFLRDYRKIENKE